MLRWGILLILLIPGLASALNSAGTLAPGAKIRITAPTVFPWQVTGNVVSVRDDSLEVSLREEFRGKSAMVPLSSIQAVEGTHGKKGHALSGMLLGLVSGAIVGGVHGANQDDYEDMSGVQRPKARVFVESALGGLVGMGLGAIIGGQLKSDRWERLQPDALALMQHEASTEPGTSTDQDEVPARPPRNHLALTFGRQKIFNDELKEAPYWPDMTHAAYWSLAYRRSLGRGIDVTIDLRRMPSSGKKNDSLMRGTMEMVGELLGPGVRYTLAQGRIRPYAQLNLFLVGVGGDQPTSFAEADGSTGVGVSAGLDFYLTRLISIPVEANYAAVPYVPGAGANAGLALHW